ncbi:MAG: tetratricopeptide repeat protein [Woeseiaceae bacterium]|nr:tetratricopeptide repeat protein [Woeseiaceae bacterium]
MQSPEAEFGKAVSAFQAQDYDRAKKLCTRILKRKQLEADASHLLALIYKQEGKFRSAQKYFERSLEADPNQAAVLSNFANLLMQNKDHAAAEEAYRRATTLDPAQTDAWHNWAVLLNSLQRFAEAADKIQSAIALQPNEPKLHIVLGIALRGMEEYGASIEACDMAIAQSSLTTPIGVVAAQNKAITYRESNRPELASKCMAGLIERDVKSPEVYFIKACSEYDAGDYERTEADLFQAIALNPAYVDAHEALNKLYWEQGDDDKFLSSYVANVDRAPDAKALRYSYAAQLIQAGREEEAAAVLSQAVEQIGPEADLLHALGVLAMRGGDYERARGLIDQALGMLPLATRFRIDMANLLIREEDYAGALQQLEVAGNADPLDQEVWAFRGLCWRLMGDEKAAWLNDYDRLVQVAYLDVPEGYDDLEHFLRVLRGALESLHKTNRQPLDQSVRNGTQTVGRLLSVPDQVIQDYKRVLSRSIRSYIEGLPDDPDHPFLNRNNRAFVHSGSWSVKLMTGGFHTNHMHPQGWLSNCTYVSIPTALSPDDPEQKGWIRFGETSLKLGEREAVGKAVCPQEGMHVLFPSFMWHGTVPFDSSEHRMTMPSDIMPKP